MKKIFLQAKTFGLALGLSLLPVAGMLTGCAGDKYHQSTGESIDDERISMNVRSALSGDSEYKYEGVSVKTFKGTVQLSGFVDTSAQKSKAGDLAKGVTGVKDMANNITVKS